MNNSLSDTLQATLKVPEGTPISIGSITDSIEEKGFGLLLLILSLPSALPVPAPGYSTPFGIALIVLGFQMLKAAKKPLLPQRARKLNLNYKLAQKMIQSGCKVLHFLEKFIRPRKSILTSLFGHQIMGILVIIMAALMILPIPLTNTAPAGVIFLIGAALSENDGIVLYATFLLGTAATFLYGFVLFWCIPFLIQNGWESRDQLKDLVVDNLKNLF